MVNDADPNPGAAVMIACGELRFREDHAFLPTAPKRHLRFLGTYGNIPFPCCRATRYCIYMLSAYHRHRRKVRLHAAEVYPSRSSRDPLRVMYMKMINGWSSSPTDDMIDDEIEKALWRGDR